MIKADIVIAGGAIMGAAAAYFLAADSSFQGDILLVERDPAFQRCATTRSWGGVRQQFSLPENIAMSKFARQFLAEAEQLLRVGDEFPQLSFKANGYLFLARAEGLEQLTENVKLQQSHGAGIELLDPDQLSARFSWLRSDDLAAGAFGAAEGWLDPAALLYAFRRKAAALGVKLLHDEVEAVRVQNHRVSGVRLAKAGEVICAGVINAAGPWADALAAMAGLSLPVRPRKRMTFVFDCRTDLSHAPLTIDPTGVAFRPESGRYLGLVSPPEAQDRDGDDLELDYDLFETVIWPALAHRVPAFEAVKLTNAWAGLYDFNTFDQNAIIGAHPELAGFWLCNGFSGHGIQQSPAAGRAIAELIVHGGFQSLDLSAFSYQRIIEGKPYREANIV